MWTKTTQLLLLGYLSMTRSFSYLGIPTLVALGLPVPLLFAIVPLFVGEIVLGLFLAFRSKLSLGRGLRAMVLPSPLSSVSWFIFVFLAYGLFQAARGIFLEGHSTLTTLQSMAFNYYPLYFFLGLWIAESHPDFLQRFIRALAWWNGIYGVAYILFLSLTETSMPGTGPTPAEGGVPLFGQPAGSAIAILGLLCFERKISSVWLPMALNSFVLLGMQVRAEWLSFVIGLFVWGWISKRLGRVAVGAAAVSVLIALGYFLDVSIPAPRGEISVTNIAGRVVATVDEQAAAQYTQNVETYVGTIDWRTNWWSAIWREVHQDTVRALIGFGYGYALTDLVPYLRGIENLRTPHNVFFYALGFGGWIGALIFALLLLTMARLIWRSNRESGEPFGLVFCAASVTVALFSNFFETPYGAIPFYVTIGAAAAPSSMRVAVLAPAEGVLPRADRKSVV